MDICATQEPDHIIPLTPCGDSLRARSVQLSGISPTHSSGNTLLVAPFQTSTKRLQKNCMECTCAHCRCVFLSMDDVNCTRCNKFHLSCQFRFSGMFNIFIILIIETICSHSSTHIVFFSSHFRTRLPV